LVESDIDATFSRQRIKVIAPLLQQSILNQTLASHVKAETAALERCMAISIDLESYESSK